MPDTVNRTDWGSCHLVESTNKQQRLMSSRGKRDKKKIEEKKKDKKEKQYRWIRKAVWAITKLLKQTQFHKRQHCRSLCCACVCVSAMLLLSKTSRKKQTNEGSVPFPLAISRLMWTWSELTFRPPHLHPWKKTSVNKLQKILLHLFFLKLCDPSNVAGTPFFFSKRSNIDTQAKKK